MRRITHFAIAVALITLAISAFWAYRVRAEDEAAQFAPAMSQHIVLPVGTVMAAVIPNGIASSAVDGDKVTAFTSTPVFFLGSLVIPPGTQLEGHLEQVSVAGANVKAHIRFFALTIGARSFTIQARPVVVFAPARSDTKILTSALKTIVGAVIGAGIGATSGDQRLVERGLLEGARAGLSIESTVPILVTLLADLRI